MGKSALILLDLQDGILDRHIKDGNTDYLPRVSTSIRKARAAGIHVIHVKTSFRPGHPEISLRNALLAPLVSHGAFIEGEAVVNIAHEVAPADGDIVVTKRRVSAFAGSDLDTVLRGLGIDSLILGGVATSGAVLSTMRQAADMDFSLTVVSDLCLDPDPEVHRILTEKVFPHQGLVLSADEWSEKLLENRS